MTTVFATAADEAYGYHALNLVASLKANSNVFDQVIVHDLGLTAHQRELLGRLPAVELRRVPAFSPHWSRGFTWKPWIFTHLEADTVFYLDAGATLLRSLAPALEQIRERGYFVVSQGNELRDIAPPDYLEAFALPEPAARRPYVAAGIIGFETGTAFFERVIVPTYEDCMRGLSLGFSAAEAAQLNSGLGYDAAPIVRDCRHFRWDQTVLNLHLAKELPDAFVNDLDEYAGWQSPRDHPRQVIWSHRRRGDFRYLKRAPYDGPGALRARLWGASYEVRWFMKLNQRFLQRATYVAKGRLLIADVLRWRDRLLRRGRAKPDPR
jgi:hypothetical protein